MNNSEAVNNEKYEHCTPL